MTKEPKIPPGVDAAIDFVNSLTPAQKLTCGYALSKANAIAKALGVDRDFAFLLRLQALYCYVHSRCGEGQAKHLVAYIRELRKTERFQRWSKDISHAIVQAIAKCERKTLKAVRKMVDDCQNELGGFVALMQVNAEEWR